MGAKGGTMSTFRSAFVALALAGITTTIGCAESEEDAAARACESQIIAPSCISDTNPPPVKNGQFLVVPTEEFRPSNNLDGSAFPVRFRLDSFTPKPGSIVYAPFKMTWSVTISVDTFANPNEGVSFQLFPSNDRVNKSGPAFGGGGAKSGETLQFSETGAGATPGSVNMMNSTFKHIILEVRWLKSGVGAQFATHVFENVDLGQ